MAVATLIARSEVRFLRRDIDLDDLQECKFRLGGSGSRVLGFGDWELGRVLGYGIQDFAAQGLDVVYLMFPKSVFASCLERPNQSMLSLPGSPFLIPDTSR